MQSAVVTDVVQILSELEDMLCVSIILEIATATGANSLMKVHCSVNFLLNIWR
jgi:hypothetical protein